ncbi:hypothetical protein B0H15DRAFT_848817 [Mycena belliarum]|uniref:Uncharacterized protein n=1 Tax=Mycena belliarum TaxID=1033014 RepID=A0AAD6TYP8_9AGAR|nr:hypothetical protein B0H15DRAFT_848817 [Mycena belliae]
MSISHTLLGPTLCLSAAVLLSHSATARFGVFGSSRTHPSRPSLLLSHNISFGCQRQQSAHVFDSQSHQILPLCWVPSSTAVIALPSLLPRRRGGGEKGSRPQSPLILHLIAAGMSGLASFFGAFGMCYRRAGTAVMVFAFVVTISSYLRRSPARLLATLATISCLLAFLFDMVLFGIARHSFRKQDIPAQYGNACWFALAAFVALLLEFFAAVHGVLARYPKE